MSFEKKIPSDDTLKNGLKDIADAIYDAEAAVRKEDVNTGTFDPTSNDPAGQKSIAGALASKDDYYATYAIARFSNLKVDNYYELKSSLPLFGNATNLAFFMRGMTIEQRSETTLELPAFGTISRADDAFSFASDCPLTTILFDDFNGVGYCLFRGASSLKKILVKDGATARIISFANACFEHCNSLEEIGAFDCRDNWNFYSAFNFCNSLKHIHLKNIHVSFDISASTQFEEADLVEIIGNLVDLTGKTSQTLTMGAENLAKLTDEEKAVATNKNWILA